MTFIFSVLGAPLFISVLALFAVQKWRDAAASPKPLKNATYLYRSSFQKKKNNNVFRCFLGEDFFKIIKYKSGR